MTTITLPRSDVSMLMDLASGMPSRDWYRWARDITARVGGVTGAGTNDLAESAFEDAGIEETKALTASVADAAGQVPAGPDLLALLIADNQRLSGEVEELRALINELWKFAQDARQGVLLS
ncbi:MAG TPA: hypothetical protein PLN91_02970 [Rhodanobacteraceae bacterium]|nr:hypothetical protein [Rhodanobacteraceae bacterium]